MSYYPRQFAKNQHSGRFTSLPTNEDATHGWTSALRTKGSHGMRHPSQHSEDLDIALIFVSPPLPTLGTIFVNEKVSLLSAVCSAFIINAQGS